MQRDCGPSPTQLHLPKATPSAGRTHGRPGRRWCCCTGRRSRPTNGIASRRSWPGSVPSISTTCWAMAAPTCLTAPTSRSISRTALWQRCSITGTSAKPDVVAHDFGGATALRAHLIDGCDYRSLTLIDPVAVRPWGSPLIQHVRRYEAAFADMPAYMHHAILPAYVRSALHRPITDEALAPYLEPGRASAVKKHSTNRWRRWTSRQTDAVQGRYGELRCPVQVLWGEQDQWIPIERGRELASLLPNARFIAVPDSGHLHAGRRAGGDRCGGAYLSCMSWIPRETRRGKNDVLQNPDRQSRRDRLPRHPHGAQAWACAPSPSIPMPTPARCMSRWPTRPCISAPRRSAKAICAATGSSPPRWRPAPRRSIRATASCRKTPISSTR